MIGLVIIGNGNIIPDNGVNYRPIKATLTKGPETVIQSHWCYLHVIIGGGGGGGGGRRR